MTHLINKNGKKTAVINVFIDPQWGFTDPSIPSQQGGSLYVPGGEGAAAGMGKIITETRNGIFVIGQDYHPSNHISFAPNHPGVMEYRIAKFKDFLTAHGQPIPEDAATLYEQAQQPVHFFHGYDQPPVDFPFEELVLNEDGNIIGLKEADGRIRKVDVATESGATPSKDDRGRVTAVLDAYYEKDFDTMRSEGILLHTQTLWTRHCEQGKQSSLYPESMNLPQGLRDKLEGDLKSDVVSYYDADTGNQFHVVRKGTHPEVDSYGIGVENDGETLTPAWKLFGELAKSLKKEGAEQVEFNVGGLATNFCVEFSVNNIADFLAGHFKMKGMETLLNFIPDISHAIPIPGDADVPFSANGAYARMQRSRGVGQISGPEIIAQQKPEASITGNLHAATSAQHRIIGH